MKANEETASIGYRCISQEEALARIRDVAVDEDVDQAHRLKVIASIAIANLEDD